MAALTMTANCPPCDRAQTSKVFVGRRLLSLAGGLRPGKQTACSSSRVRNAVPRLVTTSAPHSLASAEAAPSSPPTALPSRRELLLNLAAATAVYTAGPATPAFAEEALSAYEDAIDKFKVTVPSGWVKGEGGATAQRRVVAFYPPDDPDSNVSIIATNIGADYPSMGSFGDAYGFGFRLVGSLDRRNAKDRPQKAVLLDTKERNGIYYVEYTLEQPGVFARDLYSATGIGFNGTYNRLFTVTGQFRREDRAQFEALMKQIVNSFELPN